MRIERWMAENLPGLFRELKKLKKQLGPEAGKVARACPKNASCGGLVHWWLTGSPAASGNPL
jgi:hypothetical protein